MNAAFLLLTTAWMAGDTPLDGQIVAVSHCGPSCAPACAPKCCEPSCGHRCSLWDKLCGCFRKDCCNDCAPACQPACQPTCQPACQPKCCAPAPCDCGHRKLFCCNLFKKCCHNDCCQPACQPACQPKCCQPVCCQPSCDDCCGHRHHCGLFSKLKGLFCRKHCCDNCCEVNACGNGGPAPKAGETITTPPKKMPGGNPPAKEVNLEGAQAITPVAPAIQTAPAIPQPDAAINRNPF